MTWIRTTGLVCLLVVTVACSDEQATDSSRKQTMQPLNVEAPVRSMDFAQITRGERIFKDYCAECHGSVGQGAVNWTQRGADGRYPAPPLNGTGHAWHHPYAQLKNIIRQGTEHLGGSMPAWQGKLSEQEINDVIAWFIAQWPDELYAAWYRQNEQARQDG